MEWLKVLPPLVAILVVLWKKEVILALFMAILASELLLLGFTNTGSGGMLTSPFDALLATLERIITVFTDPGNTRILLFSIIVGALLALMRYSGGVSALVELLVSRGLAKTPRQVSLMTTFTGIVVFIESSLSVLTAGILSRGLFDKFKISRAKLAYIIDSTSAPICILILLNAWGAYVLALLSNYEFESSAVEILWGTIPFNFYALVTLSIVFYSVISGKYYGPMATSTNKIEHVNPDEEQDIQSTKARFMVVPLMIMVLGMIGFMLYTGDGDMARGSGSKSVFYATTIACIVAYLMMLSTGRFTNKRLIHIGFNGMSELLPIVTILLLSLALGASLKILGTGVFIAQLVGDFLPLVLIAPTIFLVGAVISFSTGTSWGTFAILIPIAAPIILLLDLPPSLIIAAVLG
ncbi:MAG: sodium:proton antiporter, partial [Enterobacterales bacterium]|nr:sodium:proton antiporter [Enterobacterales bacterium]